MKKKTLVLTSQIYGNKFVMSQYIKKIVGKDNFPLLIILLKLDYVFGRNGSTNLSDSSLLMQNLPKTPEKNVLISSIIIH